jgi:hypothetical protein
MELNLMKKTIQERNECKEFIQQNYFFKKILIKEVLPKIKPIFLLGETINIYFQENPELYAVVDSKVSFPSTLESVSSRNIPPLAHANQGDSTKAIAENLWLIGNFTFSIWNHVHVAAAKRYTGFLAINYMGTNFSRITPDKEYNLRTKIDITEKTYFSVLYEKNKPLAYAKGTGIAKKLDFYK